MIDLICGQAIHRGYGLLHLVIMVELPVYIYTGRSFENDVKILLGRCLMTRSGNACTIACGIQTSHDKFPGQ